MLSGPLPPRAVLLATGQEAGLGAGRVAEGRDARGPGGRQVRRRPRGNNFDINFDRFSHGFVLYNTLRAPRAVIYVPILIGC